MSIRVTPETPWLGLRYFSEEDRDYFFGRTQELRDLYERVIHKPLTVLFGQSGLGKTSLLRAGLIPRLRSEGFTPVLIRLDHSADSLAYEQQVLLELVLTLALPSEPVLATTMTMPQTLWEFFHDPACGFISPDGMPRARPVLLFDQFEEIFTLGASSVAAPGTTDLGAASRRERVAAFRDALAGLVENRIPETIRRAMENDDALAERL